MHPLAVASAFTVLLAPLLLGLGGWWQARRQGPATRRAGASALVWSSALALTLAFNLQFFVQELFLVLPKAMTPGLEPVLFHNNHSWQGSNPLAELFQGTGALATLIVGLLCALFVPRARGAGLRLLLIWSSYVGILMALAQVVIGAVSPFSDVGRALVYLQATENARLAAALVALLLMPAAALWLLRELLSLDGNATPPASARTRARFVLQAATLPALLAIALIVPFRVPRNAVEVVVVPAAVMIAGIPWMQALAFRATPARAPGSITAPRPLPLLVAVLALLALFQCALRPGIAF